MAVVDRKLKEKAQRHEAILHAAETLLLKKGIYNLQMDAVAKEAELAKGTLYLYFKSKEEILGALSVKARLLLLDYFKKAVLTTSDPIEQLKAIAYATFNYYELNPVYFELISIYEVNNQLHETDAIRDSTNQLTDFVIEIATNAKSQNKFDSELDPVEFTFCMWGMVIGMAQLIKVRGNVLSRYRGISEKSIIETFMQQLERGMRG